MSDSVTRSTTGEVAGEEVGEGVCQFVVVSSETLGNTGSGRDETQAAAGRS